MKRLLNFKTKYKILLFLQRFKSFSFFNDFAIDETKKKAYIFLAADYGNLGDVAITHAQTEFLKNNTNYQIVEIPISQSLEGLWFVKKHIRQGDIVTTVGGGNMGDQYDQIEFIRQLVFQFFPNNKIISFPQTFDFSDTPKGYKALRIAQSVYKYHKNLVVVAREEISFELMKNNFPYNKVILTPDIVLSLDKTISSNQREGVIFCLRNDKEKSLSFEDNRSIRTVVGEYFSRTEDYDTHINRDKLSVSERLNELIKIWKKFQLSELVITDRLHGMIFCYITNTPCIVFQNNNHKVKETYKWFGKTSPIFLMEEFSMSVLKEYLKNKKWKHSFTFASLDHNYNILKNELLTK